MKTARSILVVDDDPGVRLVLEGLLGSAGYRVRAAADGRAALQLYRQAPADLVLMDLIMPEQEGLETISQLRQEFPEARIVAMSGAHPDHYLHAAGLLGADATLHKPFGPKEPLRTIARVLEEFH
ncbi:MAG: response regulator [Bryobacterales bacterium]|nr:response regulator [Bryobacterales bacterium]